MDELCAMGISERTRHFSQELIELALISYRRPSQRTRLCNVLAILLQGEYRSEIVLVCVKWYCMKSMKRAAQFVMLYCLSA